MIVNTPPASVYGIPEYISVVMFDMDHTLIDNDCDVSWKKFLVQKKLAPRDAMAQADVFYQQYVSGELDLEEFLAFQLAEFAGRPIATMEELAREHCEAVVCRCLYRDAVEAVKTARSMAEYVAICTSTNEIIARPVAEWLGIPNLLATRLAVENGVFTGDIEGTYCGGEGKVVMAGTFCQERGRALADVAYFGDSPADIPLLARVGKPVAVNPAPGLRMLAQERGWRIQVFR